MKLYFIEQDSLDYLKANIKNHIKYYESPTSDWIYSVCGKSPFREFSGEFPGLVLQDTDPNPYSTDYINAVSIYSSLNTISESVATDERLWAGMALKQFWHYTHYRWIPNNQVTEEKIRYHFYFGAGIRRSLTRHSIARLWWIAKLSYDRQRDNPFELTAFLCEASSFIVDVLERNTSNNPDIMHSFLDAVLEIRRRGVQITRERMRDLVTYLNLLGGTYILDVLPAEMIKQKILTYGIERYEQQ